MPPTPKQEWTPPAPQPQGFTAGFFQNSVSFPSLEDIEQALVVFSLTLFWTDSRGHRIALQRSVVVTTKTQEALQKEITAVFADLRRLAAEERDKRDYTYELVPIEELALDKKPQLAHDSVITALERRLAVAKKSLKTGEVYADPTMRYCPHTKTRLGFFITARPQ